MATNQCDVNDSKLQLSSDPRDVISVVGGNSIEVVETRTLDKLIFTVNYREYAAPTITVNTLIEKVGVTIPTVKFDASFNKGSVNFISRTMTPDKGLDLTIPFTWNEENVRGIEAGLWPRFNGSPILLSCNDEKGTTVTKQVGVEYRNLFYMGYSNKDTLTEADVKTLGNTYEKTLLTSIKSKYSSYEYDYRGFTTYLYWVYPIGTPEIISAFEGAQNVPLYINPTPLDIEDSGVTTAYRVVRTAVPTKFLKSIIKLV